MLFLLCWRGLLQKNGLFFRDFSRNNFLFEDFRGKMSSNCFLSFLFWREVAIGSQNFAKFPFESLKTFKCFKDVRIGRNCYRFGIRGREEFFISFKGSNLLNPSYLSGPKISAERTWSKFSNTLNLLNLSGLPDGLGRFKRLERFEWLCSARKSGDPKHLGKFWKIEKIQKFEKLRWRVPSKASCALGLQVGWVILPSFLTLAGKLPRVYAMWLFQRTCSDWQASSLEVCAYQLGIICRNSNSIATRSRCMESNSLQEFWGGI